MTKHRYVKPDIKAGDRVKVVHSDDPVAPLEAGDVGTVSLIDGAGTIHVEWDSGRTLGLIPGEDHYIKLKEGK